MQGASHTVLFSAEENIVFVFLPTLLKDMEPNYYIETDKQIVADFCKKFIKNNGYIRVGYATDNAVKGKTFESQGHRMSFINSVSAMLVNTGQYIREENKKNHGDYDILLNPNYFLNKSVISTNNVTRLIAVLAFIISLISLIKDFKKSNDMQVPELQETNTQLKKQEIVIDSLSQRMKSIDYSLQKIGVDFLKGK